jgi:hypothetical protein
MPKHFKLDLSNWQSNFLTLDQIIHDPVLKKAMDPEFRRAAIHRGLEQKIKDLTVNGGADSKSSRVHRQQEEIKRD